MKMQLRVMPTHLSVTVAAVLRCFAWRADCFSNTRVATPQAFTAHHDDGLQLSAFAAWRTLAFVVFRSGELTKRMALLLQPVKHALLHDTQPSLLEVLICTVAVASCSMRRHNCP